jgi:hypothetical protein
VREFEATNMNTGSVTAWMGALRDGDEAAARRIWEGYRTAMLRIAARQLPHR